MANVPYSNFFLSNEIEDQFNSHLDLTRFCTVDNGLTGTAGMVRKIHKYSATNGTEKLAKGVGNTQTIEAGYTEVDYTIQLVQNRFVYYDEEAMTDPMIVPVGMRHAGTDMFNTVNADIFAEYNKATRVLPVASISFGMFADGVSMLNLEEIEGVEIFAFVNPTDMSAVRKALKDDLKYVEAFARSGYVGTVAGVNLYTKKDAVTGTIILGMKKAVTLFNKKGVEVEQSVPGNRSSDDANVRKSTIHSRKYYLAALTDERYAVKMLVGATATACPSTETTVDSTKTYYAADGAGYIEVTPAAGDNPYTKGWYTIA